MSLQIRHSYTGVVKKVSLAVKELSHAKADYKYKWAHNLTVVVDKKNYELEVFSMDPDDAGCKEGDTIGFQVRNWHEGAQNYFASLLPPQISVGDMRNIPELNTAMNVNGTMAERALSLAVGYYQYHTDATVNNLFSMADLMLGWMGSRLKMEGYE